MLLFIIIPGISRMSVVLMTFLFHYYHMVLLNEIFNLFSSC